MTSDRYHKITQIMREVLAMPAGARAAYLNESCAGDPELRSQIDAMLSRQESATIPGGGAVGSDDILFETPANEKASRIEGDTRQKIGKYTILEVLGEGGMGMVYLAEQDRPRRTVALKVIRPGLLTPRMLRRFELESQVLGRLQHQGIAQVYDAGTADNGSGPQPFFAMEHVKGLPLGEYIRSRDLPLRQKLGLFIKVCEAVQHAHQKGVIHRDLKPGNILVTAEGEPKVLDFGVARATDSDSQGATLETAAGQLVGTLPYMSPEQVAGNTTDLDTRSDVYTLGVILYELLSGRLPHAISDKTLPEAVRIIGMDEPTPLAVVDRSLKGDLATIVAKALEKDRARRYQSASELGADVVHYLRSEPITARPPSTWYQLCKFTGRNRALVGGVAAAFILLCLGIIGTAWQAAQATEGRRLATEKAQTTSEINAFLISMLGASNPEQTQGVEPTVRELVDTMAQGIGDRFKDRPAVELEVRETLGHSYSALSRYDEAAEQYTVMLGICRQQFGDEHRQTLAARRSLEGVWADQGKYDKAEAEIKDIIAVMERTLGKEDADTALAEMELARIYQETGRLKEAETLIRRTVQVVKRERGELDVQAITAIQNLGIVLKDLGQNDEAVANLREALRLRLQTLGPNHPDTLYAKNNLAACLQRSARPEDQTEAEKILRENLADRTRVLGEGHVATITSVSNLAVILIEQKKYEEALPLTEKVYQLWLAKLGEEHQKTLIALANLAYLYEDLGRLKEAEEMYRKGIAIRKRVTGGKDPETWSPMNNLAMLLQKRGDLAEADAAYRELLVLCEGVLPKTHPYPAIFRNNFGECLTLEKKYDEAEESLLSSQEVLEAKFGAGHVRVNKGLARLAALYQAKGDAAKAAAYRARLEPAK